MPKQPNGQIELHPALQTNDVFDLNLAGERVDGRSVIARRFKALGNELVAQLGSTISPAEKILLRNAATLAVLCERDSAAVIEGKDVDEENYRRNVQALNAVLIKLGLALKSRDAKPARALDAHAAAILDAE